MSVLRIFYVCYATNHKNLSVSRQLLLVTYSVKIQSLDTRWLGSLLGYLQGWNQDVSWLHSQLGHGVPFKPVVGRIQFLVLVGLRSLSPCWLSAGDHSRISCHLAFLLHLAFSSQNQQR